MKRIEFLRGFLALPFVGHFRCLEPEVVPVCHRCNGTGVIIVMDTPDPFCLRNDYLPDDGGWSASERPCPACYPEIEFVATSVDEVDVRTEVYMNEQYSIMMKGKDETFAKAVERARKKLLNRFREETYRMMYGGRG